jgi:hypothetical protein
MLEVSQTVGFGVIVCLKFSVKLGRMAFLLVEKLNDDLLLRVHAK